MGPAMGEGEKRSRAIVSDAMPTGRMKRCHEKKEGREGPGA